VGCARHSHPSLPFSFHSLQETLQWDVLDTVSHPSLPFSFHSLQETLQWDVLDTETPPEECCASGSNFGDAMLPALSIDGVTKYLARKHGKETVRRNMGYIQEKLSEREMMMVSL
jgi:hypothetical protein